MFELVLLKQTDLINKIKEPQTLFMGGSEVQHFRVKLWLHYTQLSTRGRCAVVFLGPVMWGVQVGQGCGRGVLQPCR